jgi:hypothetical protein
MQHILFKLGDIVQHEEQAEDAVNQAGDHFCA